jgi:archaellum component FlaC
LSTNDIIPSSWQPFLQIVAPIGLFVTILICAIRLTRYITKVENNIIIKTTELEGKVTKETTRLEGRINQLEDRIKDVKCELQRQGRELSNLTNYLLNNARFLVKVGEMKEDNNHNVKSD